MEYFKYLSPERADVLENLKLRYTQAHALNDPFESFPGIIQKDKEWYKNAFSRKIKLEAESHEFKTEVKRKQYLRARKKEFANFYECYTDEKWLYEQAQSVILMDSVIQGYLSLSKTNMNVLMWSHYAKNHSGYVLGFDSAHEYFDYGVEEVIYSDERPYLDPTQSKQDASVFYTKSTDWKYEKEIRKSQGFVEPIQLENGNTLLPFPDDPPQLADKKLTEVKLFDFPKESVSSVILGWHSSQELENTLISSLRAHRMIGVGVFKAVPHRYKYEMELTKINET